MAAARRPAPPSPGPRAHIPPGASVAGGQREGGPDRGGLGMKRSGEGWRGEKGGRGGGGGEGGGGGAGPGLDGWWREAEVWHLHGLAQAEGPGRRFAQQSSLP